ncbi:MAG: hypothetical protein FJ027_16675 [Candidatus Rokubacteria bacterium]|nr:hypothetical protein [Candidatus Rokubacteria bacterium]
MHLGLIGGIGPAATLFYYRHLARAHAVAGRPLDLTSMGLAIARTIVEAHRGRLTAANNESAGATFRFSIPVDGARA